MADKSMQIRGLIGLSGSVKVLTPKYAKLEQQTGIRVTSRPGTEDQQCQSSQSLIKAEKTSVKPKKLDKARRHFVKIKH